MQEYPQKDSSKNIISAITLLDLRGFVPYPSQKQPFVIPLSEYSVVTQRYPDKEKLRAIILALRDQGMSFRAIGSELGIHSTRVWQITQDT